MGLQVRLIHPLGDRLIELTPCDAAAPVVIGRSADAGISVPSVNVSRKHCMIYVRENRWVLQDGGGSRGTFLNGKAVNGVVTLNFGDVITLGAEQDPPTLVIDPHGVAASAAEFDAAVAKTRAAMRADARLRAPAADAAAQETNIDAQAGPNIPTPSSMPTIIEISRGMVSQPRASAVSGPIAVRGAAVPQPPASLVEEPADVDAESQDDSSADVAPAPVQHDDGGIFGGTGSIFDDASLPSFATAPAPVAAPPPGPAPAYSTGVSSRSAARGPVAPSAPASAFASSAQPPGEVDAHLAGPAPGLNAPSTAHDDGHVGDDLAHAAAQALSKRPRRGERSKLPMFIIMGLILAASGGALFYFKPWERIANKTIVVKVVEDKRPAGGTAPATPTTKVVVIPIKPPATRKVPATNSVVVVAPPDTPTVTPNPTTNADNPANPGGNPASRNDPDFQNLQQTHDTTALTSPEIAIVQYDQYLSEKPDSPLVSDVRGFIDDAMDRLWWIRVHELAAKRADLAAQVAKIDQTLADDTVPNTKKDEERERQAPLKQALEDARAQLAPLRYTSDTVPDLANAAQLADLRKTRDATAYERWRKATLGAILRTRGVLPWKTGG